MTQIILIGLLALSTHVARPISIPPGTILPIELRSSINSKKSKPGQIITGRIMQDVPIVELSKIPAGAKVIGHVIKVTPASGGHGADVSFRFDIVRASGQRLRVKTNLRAVASLVDVDQAQLPLSGPAPGTSPDSWTTRQIGGEIVFRGGGPVRDRAGVVAQPVPGGVLGHVQAVPEKGCPGEFEGNNRPQALWLFSTTACGVYGFLDLQIVDAGRTNPDGEIVLRSDRGDINIRSGSGMLLRVDAQLPE